RTPELRRPMGLHRLRGLGDRGHVGERRAERSRVLLEHLVAREDTLERVDRDTAGGLVDDRRPTRRCTLEIERREYARRPLIRDLLQPGHRARSAPVLETVLLDELM